MKMTDKELLQKRLQHKKLFLLTQLQNIEEIIADVREIIELSE